MPKLISIKRLTRIHTHGPQRARLRQRLPGSPALAPPLDRHDRSSPRSASAAPDAPLEIRHLGLTVEPEPPQELRRQQRHVMAGGAIDPEEIATPEIVDPRQVQRQHPGLRSRNVLRALADLVNGTQPSKHAAGAAPASAPAQGLSVPLRGGLGPGDPQG